MKKHLTSVKDVTHQANNKEIRHCDLNTLQQLQPTANLHARFAPIRGNNCLYQQVAVVYICPSKRETETRTANIQTVNKAAFAYHLEYEYHVDHFFHSRRTCFMKIHAFLNYQVRWTSN